MVHAQSSQDELYEYWKTDAAQNSLRMARQLGIPEGTVQAWVSRGRWRARAKADDARDFADAVAYARRGVAAQLQHSVSVLAAGLISVIDDQGKPMEGTPTPQAIKIARDNLATFGITPQKQVVFEARDTEATSLAAISAILESEDHEALLAVLQGGPPPEKYAAIEAEVIDPNPRQTPVAPSPEETGDPARNR